MVRPFVALGLLLIGSPGVTDSNIGENYYAQQDAQQNAQQNAQQDEIRQLQVKEALNQARESDKHLLLVIGADWCKDSRVLAEQLQSSDVRSVIEAHYQQVTLNAGWLEDLSGVLSQFGHPAYFGTPTLLIIDPDTVQVTNFSSVQRWQSAHSESASALARYLNQFVSVPPPTEFATPDWLVEFELRQSQRLYHAYQLLGSQLEQESMDESVNADALWDEVRRFRYQLQHDLVRLYQVSENQSDSKPDTLPAYPPMSFE